MINQKKAEMTTEQIVLLIILIVSFIIILFLIFRLGIGSTSDSQVCHNSVVTRSSGVLPKESSPLNCKTQYLCVSQDGSCDEMTSPQIQKVKTADDVYKILADNMANCWWMFGEGKLNYVGSEFTSNLYCSICYQVGFDKSVNSIFRNGVIGKKDFYNYMANNNASQESESYLQYLNGIKDANSIQQTLTNGKASFGEIDISKQYYVVMGISSQVGTGQWAAVGAGLGFLVGGPIGLIVGGAGSYLLGTTVSGISGHQYLSPTLIEANSADFNSLNCSSIKTLS